MPRVPSAPTARRTPLGGAGAALVQADVDAALDILGHAPMATA